LISGSYSPGDLYFFAGTDSGFAQGAAIPEAAAKDRSASAPSLADWDGDGDLDILVGNIAGNVSLLENVGTKTAPRFEARVKLEAGGRPLRTVGDAHPVAVDWDGDGVLDLLIGEDNGSALFCKGSRAEGKKTPTLAAPVPLRTGGKPVALGKRSKLCVTDWNGDGKPDLLLGNYEGGQRGAGGHVYVLLRNGVATEKK
jgi:hypothetical protein